MSRVLVLGVALLAGAGARAQEVALSFTAAQVEQGRAVYDATCVMCHGANLDDGPLAPPLKGDAFMRKYGGKPARALFDLLRTTTNRAAHYYCVIVVVRNALDPQPLIAEGVWSGEVLLEPRGSGGFGYDPYFFVPSLGKTAAELPMEIKNRISHRGKALDCLIERLCAT